MAEKKKTKKETRSKKSTSAEVKKPAATADCSDGCCADGSCSVIKNDSVCDGDKCFVIHSADSKCDESGCSVIGDEADWLGKILTAENSSFDKAMEYAYEGGHPLLVEYGHKGCGECELFKEKVTNTKAWASFLKATKIVMYRTMTLSEFNALYKKYSYKCYRLNGSYPWLVMYSISKGKKGLEASTPKTKKGSLYTAQVIGLGGMSTLFGVKIPKFKNMSSKDIGELVNAWFPNNVWK